MNAEVNKTETLAKKSVELGGGCRETDCLENDLSLLDAEAWLRLQYWKQVEDEANLGQD